MISKEKIMALTKYLANLTNRLSDPTPAKHKGHPASYKQFLEREIQAVKTKLDNAKLEGAGK